MLVGGGNTQSANYAEVNLVPHANHDLEDAHGNRLDPTLPTGNAYQGYVFDSRGPNPRLSASVVTHDGFTPITVTVNFGEPVTGFRSSDLALGGATVTGFTGADGASVYTVQLTPTGSRRITVRVPRGVATDRDGHANDPSNPGSLWIEHDPIGVTFTPRELTVPEGGSATYSVVLEAQPLQNVTINVATVAGGDGDVTLSGSSSLTFTRGNWNRAQTVRIAAAEDNDCSRGRTRFSHTSSSNDPVYNGIDLPQVTAWEGDNDPDCTAPTVRSIERHNGSQAQGQYTRANSLTFRVTFSESVTGVEASDFSASGTTATATGITGSGARYVVTVSGGNLNGLDSTVGLSIAASHGITDQAQNVARTPLVNALVNTTPTGANQSYTVDNTAPTAVLARADGGSGTLSAAFDVTVTFTEANGLSRTGAGAFASGDLSVTNGSVTSLTGGPLVWTATVTPNANVMGNVTVDLPANSVTDWAGNGNTAATQLSVPVDNNPASVASITRHSGTTSGAGGLTNADTLTFTVTFGETVDGVDAADFDATGTSGADATNVTGSGATRTVTVGGGTLASHEGEVGLALASGNNIVDAGGNGLSSTTPTGTVETYTLDNTAPTAALARADGLATTLNGAFDVTVTFTEANGLQTTGAGALAAGDFDVGNGSVTALAGTGLVWTATVTPNTGVTGNVQVGLPANAVRDRAGNGNTAAARLTVPVDTVVPTVASIARDDGAGNDPGADTNADSVRFRVTFSESVTNVHAADFNASGAGDATNVTGSGDSRVVTVSGSGLATHNDAVGLTFATSQDIADAAGNRLDATLPTGTNYQTYTLDNTAPRVASVERHDGAGAQDEVTSADTLTFRVTFSEVVENVDAADFNASGTTGDATMVDAVTGNDAQYIVTVAGGNLATFNGAVGLTFATNQNIADPVGNRLSNTTPTGANETYTLDNTAPRASSIARDDGAGADPGQRTNADSLQFRVTFSKAVANVDTADFAASGTTAAATAVDAVTGNAAQYVVTVSGGNLNDRNGVVGLTFA
ncbi:MAG: Ig-like domain-containing protein, partial [bacterium]|nr:Ig-like domain-containing protein [bacterium]